MKLRNLFKKSSKGGFFAYNSSGDGSSMIMSEYEKLKEEHDHKAQSGQETEELPVPSRIELDFQYLRKKQTEALDEEIETIGLHFDYRYSDNFLIDLFKYMKDNFDESILLCDDIIKIKKEENLPYLHYAIFGNCSNLSGRYYGNVLCNQYNNFFDMFDLIPDNIKDEKEIELYVSSKKCEFWNNLDRYLFLMLSIFDKLNDYSEDERNKFFDRTIDNFQRIKELGIDNVFIKFNGETRDLITLNGQPRGMYTKLFPFGWLKYKEENFYTDGKFEDTYNSEEHCVNIDVQMPNFIIKNRREIRDSFVQAPFNFDEKNVSITVYNLDFDGSKLPSYEEVQNTECHLDSYLTLMYDKKRELFKEKLERLSDLLEKLYGQLDDLTELSDDLGILNLLNEIGSGGVENLFSDTDLMMLDIANNDDYYDKAKVLLKQKVLERRK